MLCACVLDFEGSWDQHLSLIEFVYNNSYQSIIQMVPYETLHGRKCRSSVGWFEVGDHPLLGLDMVQDAIRKVELVEIECEQLQIDKSPMLTTGVGK